MRLVFGTRDQVSFPTEEDYYFSLGFLANSEHAEIRWEHNEEQGAWGSEGRILFKINTRWIPPFFSQTKGVGRTTARTNCNDYIEHIVRVHMFKEINDRANVNVIESTVPIRYRTVFWNGFNV